MPAVEKSKPPGYVAAAVVQLLKLCGAHSATRDHANGDGGNSVDRRFVHCRALCVVPRPTSAVLPHSEPSTLERSV